MPTIGRGYDSANKSPKSLSIFGNSMTLKEELIASFDFHFACFKSITDFKESLKHTSEFGMPIINAVNLNSALDISHALALDQDLMIYVMHVSGVRRRLTVELDEQKFEDDTHFQCTRQELSTTPYIFCCKYGDAFVKRIVYGGEIAFVIKFKRSVLERTRLLNTVQLHVTGDTDLQQAVSFLGELVFRDLECNIYTQTTGFAPDQLPLNNPKKIEELSNWLAEFSQRFNQIPAGSFQTPIGYEIASYGTILPAETIAILEHTAIRARYFFAIFRCNDAIDFYINYFQWLEDTEQQTAMELKKQELDEIKLMFALKQDLTQPEMMRNINKLKRLIEELNDVNIPPRLINEFRSADLRRNRVFGSLNIEQRVSSIFHLPKIPEQFTPDALMFEVIKDDEKPLKGNLSLLYSYNNRVLFNEAAHELARQINLGTRNIANIPPVISKDNSLNNVNFAYHLEIRRSGLHNAPIFACIRPCKNKSDEDFSVRTYVISKKPGKIMTLEG